MKKEEEEEEEEEAAERRRAARHGPATADVCARAAWPGRWCQMVETAGCTPRA